MISSRRSEGSDAQRRNNMPDDDMKYVCDVKNSEGKVCGRQFDSKKALLVHKRKTNIPEHFSSTVMASGKFVVTNQCPYCETAGL